MALLLGASAAKKRRAGVDAGQDEAATAEEDRVSALPEDLRLRILSLLPLKSAIRTGALSSWWRDLWARRWPAPSSLDLHLLPDDDPDQTLASLERRGRRRLDRFSLTVHPCSYRSSKDLRGYLDYAVACDVEDLHVDIADFLASMCCTLDLPPGCSHLARLSLRRINGVSFGYSPRRDDVFSALEIVHLRSVRHVDLDYLLPACPRLRTLDLRYCQGIRGAIHVSRRGAAHLRSLTVAECNSVDVIDADRASGLRSFRLSSASLPTYNIPATAPLDDLYVCFRGAKLRNPISYWIRELPSLTNLTTRTICSTALRRVYALARFGSAACLTRLRNLPSLRELQLLMFAMDGADLAHIYTFFRTCRCPQLERLFVQLPKNGDNTSMDTSLQMAEENEPDEELSEEEEPHEELFEEDETGEELFEEDETGEELSEEYETEEELLEEEIPEEYMLKESLFYEDVYEEDPLDEDTTSEQAEDGLPEYGLTNLILAKMMKFNGDYFEMRLVSFLLRKATGLKKLLLVGPRENHMEELGKDQMDAFRLLEAELSCLKRASSNVQIVLSESDPAEIQPVHSDIYARF